MWGRHWPAKSRRRANRSMESRIEGVPRAMGTGRNDVGRVAKALNTQIQYARQVHRGVQRGRRGQ
eukprot:8484998-Pyramimonas_sp.AAC.1